MKLLTSNTHKIDTTNHNAPGYMPVALFMLPHTLAWSEHLHHDLGTRPPRFERKSLCPMSTPECRNKCLVHSGRGMSPHALRARLERTRMFLERTSDFLHQLSHEIDLAHERAKRKGKRLCVRLNGTTDIDWTQYEIHARHPDVQFYEYTKRHDVLRQWERMRYEGKADNLHIAWSWSGTMLNAGTTDDVIRRKITSVCIPVVGKTYNERVARTRAMLENRFRWADHGFPVKLNFVDGDEHDLRFLDEPGSICVLKVKATSRKYANEKTRTHGSFIVR